jgi:hypothetical protein
MADKLQQALKVDFNDDNIALTNQRTLQTLVGLLGICLPLFLYLVVALDAHYYRPLFSISHYYMTRANPVFIIIVSLLAIFLLIYKGKSSADFYFSIIAGFFALCVVLFPTGNMLSTDPDYICSLTTLNPSELRETFHYISAAIFLTSLAYMSYFIFTRSNLEPARRTVNKRRRNRIYRVCAVIMTLALLVILLRAINVIPSEMFKENQLMFWMETIAIESFGISWLVKSESLPFLRG